MSTAMFLLTVSVIWMQRQYRGIKYRGVTCDGAAELSGGTQVFHVLI